MPQTGFEPVILTGDRPKLVRTLDPIFFYGSTALYGPGPSRFVEVSWSHTL
jgi:hypothetical protein